MKRTSLLVVFADSRVFWLSAWAVANKPDDAKVTSEIQSKFSQDSGLSTKQLTVKPTTAW